MTRFHKIIASFFLICGIFLLFSCATAPREIPGTLIVTGKMTLVGIEGGCWILETGKDLQSKGFYQLLGEKLQEVAFDGAIVQVRIRPQPKQTTTCQMGNPAELVEVFSVEKLKK